MRKNKKNNRLLAFLMCSVIAAVPIGAYADTNNTKSIPVYLSVEVPVLDYSVTECITMAFETNDKGEVINVPNLSVSDITVTNNADIGALKLVSLSASPQQGWNIISNSSDFINQSASAKSFSLVADSSDLSSGAYLFNNVQINSGDNLTIQMTGKTGSTNKTYTSENVAICVLTVSLY